MRFLNSRRAWLSFAALLVLLANVGPVRADDGLAAVYSAILRGDPDAGRAELQRLETQGTPSAELKKTESWLDAFHNAVASRQDMKAKTFEWDVDNAKTALAEGQIYLALNFAAQGAPYAPDEDAFAAESWVKDVMDKAEAEAKKLSAEQRWPDVLAYYRVLSLLRPQDKKLDDLREDAGRHARLELFYKDEAALDRRIKDVNKDLLREAVKQIRQSYYQEPDFKRMAEGALGNLITLAETKQLYDFLHGLGNPETRDYFLKSLKELQESVRGEERYIDKDLLKLFNRVAFRNTESVELPEGLLVVEFLEGATQQLDQFTSVIWPADSDDFNKMMMGDFEGVGIQLGVDERTGRLKVVTPLENSPALEAGIHPDDLIDEVDGKTTKGWTTDDAVNNIMGKAGSDVVLTVFRPATGERIPFKLVRRKIVLKTVRGMARKADNPQEWNYLLDSANGIAYVRLSGFHPESHEELVAALKQAQSQGMRGLILDVRHNPGGLLDVAVRIVSTFLRQGEVVSTAGRKDPRASQPVTDESFVVDVPLVVLVNDGSASASEILAGALKDHNRAIILGERTFGKGSVQRVLGLGKVGQGKEARVKLTTALYYLPDGRSPHKELNATTWGVDPNWELKLTPKELRQVFKRENDSLIIRNEPQSRPAEEQSDSDAKLDELKDEDEQKADDHPPLLTDEQIKLLNSDPVKPLDTDAQLETALLLLRVKLAANLPWPQQLAAKTSDAQP